MDLKLFFDPIPADLEIPTDGIAQSIYLNKAHMPDHTGMDMAIIGLKETRGAEADNQEGLVNAANEIRKQFYQLKSGADRLKIIDLGNFRNGPELDDTYLRLKEVGSYLLEQEIIPVLIGGSHDLDWGQYLAYESSEKLITMLNVDNKLDLVDPEKGKEHASHINRIIKYDPNYLFNYYHLAHQSYLVGSLESNLMEKLGFEAIRLGVVKENVKELEPVVRDADMMSFDLSAMQDQYCPGAVNAKVYGLSGEEACQLCWYAGLNDKLTSIGFYNYDVNKDNKDRKTAFVVATMIWYFIEGYYSRRGDKSFSSNDYLIYEVPMGGEPNSIRFYKSKSSEKWWMEVPHPEDEVGLMRSRMVPCNYADYQTAQQGEVPNRWLNTYTKFT